MIQKDRQPVGLVNAGFLTGPPLVKPLAKSILRTVSGLVILPAIVLYRLQEMLMGDKQVFPGWAQLFSLLPGTTGEYLRHAFYRSVSEQCDEDVCISFGTIASDRGIRLGRSSYIGHFCSLGRITIEEDVLIASHVSIMNGCRQHGTERLDIPISRQPGEFVPVTIGAGTWIGEHATVAADVGRHCIIGAGALVLRPIPDYSIAVGTPARVIGDRRDRPGQNTPDADGMSPAAADAAAFVQA